MTPTRNRTVHAIRGLAPPYALQAVGAGLDMIRPCQLPVGPPGKGTWTSLPRAAIGPTDSAAVLLAGQIGAWTFVYDDAGMTHGRGDESPARLLSVGGREAATCTEGITLSESLAYAVNGALLLDVSQQPLGSADGSLPAGLRAAVEAAGMFRPGQHDELDRGIYMRVLCALVGLSIALDELRAIPLLAAPFA
jgi:hypothetical protein